MAKIKIFVDTSADMPESLAAEKNIGILRFMSIFGDEAYVTGTELSNSAFYKKLEEFGDIPKTSQTPYADMYDALLEASRENDTVIYFTISSKGSGQYNTARMAAEEIKESANPGADIRIVDTMSFSAYISMSALYAWDLAEKGENPDDIIKKTLEYIKTWEVYILVDSLKYLEKGGRITKTSAIVGTLLDIKPVLTIRNGLIEPLEKIRGKKKVFKKLMDLIKENPDFDSDRNEFLIVQSNEEYAETVRGLIGEEFGTKPLMEFEFGPVVGTHIGPGTLAVLFRLKK